MRVNSAVVSLVAAVALLGGCVTQSAAPLATNFVFTPDTTVPATKNNMSIAIISPRKAGSFFEMDQSENAPVINQFLDATQQDLEKVIVAKGFTSAGDYKAIDEMTFSQKEKSSLIMNPEVRLNITLARSFGLQGTATAGGTISIEFLEPMSREKVWIKRFDLPPVTKQVNLALLRGPDGMLAHHADGSLVVGLARNSTVELLNEFYGQAFTKIWGQLDPKEIRGLKSDADKLKGRTNYKGG